MRHKSLKVGLYRITMVTWMTSLSINSHRWLIVLCTFMDTDKKYRLSLRFMYYFTYLVNH